MPWQENVERELEANRARIAALEAEVERLREENAALHPLARMANLEAAEATIARVEALVARYAHEHSEFHSTWDCDVAEELSAVLKPPGGET